MVEVEWVGGGGGYECEGDYGEAFPVPAGHPCDVRLKVTHELRTCFDSVTFVLGEEKSSINDDST